MWIIENQEQEPEKKCSECGAPLNINASCVFCGRCMMCHTEEERRDYARKRLFDIGNNPLKTIPKMLQEYTELGGESTITIARLIADELALILHMAIDETVSTLLSDQEKTDLGADAQTFLDLLKGGDKESDDEEE